MPYIFGLLVIANVALLGYFGFVYEPSHTADVSEHKAQSSKPITFETTSIQAPPVIGTKK